MTGKRSVCALILAAATLLLAWSASGAAPAPGAVPVGQRPARATAIPSLLADATPTPIARPLVPGVPPTAVRISEPGCCAYPRWSSDSEWVLYLDAPDGAGSSGLYAVPRAGGPPSRLTERVGIYSNDWSLVAYPEAGRVFIERWQDGERWTIPSSGRAIHFSPQGDFLAWEIGSSSIQNQDIQVRSIWVSDLKGAGLRELVTVHGGGLVGWARDEQALLVSGRLKPTGPAGIWRIELDDGAGRLLFQVDDPRQPLLSTDGGQLAVIVAFEKQPDRNGIWLVDTSDGSAQRLPFFGSYRWRSPDQLLLVPYDFDAQGPYVMQYDLLRQRWSSLTSPRFTELPISNNDWQISPDGGWMVFQSFRDRALYTVELPAVPDAP